MEEEIQIYEFKRIDGLFHIVEEDLDNLRRNLMSELDRLQARISVLERQLRESNGRRLGQ